MECMNILTFYMKLLYRSIFRDQSGKLNARFTVRRQRVYRIYDAVST
jgi:hypothetical protein